MNRPWTNKDIEQLENLILSGKYVEDIVKITGRSKTAIETMCRNYCLQSMIRKMPLEQKKGLSKDAFRY